MITLTARTVEGAPGATVAELDAETVSLSALLGGPSEPWQAAEFLRDVYAGVIRTAGAVTLAAYAGGIAHEVAA